MRDVNDALELVRKLTDIGVALSAEKDGQALLELILQGARAITGADGGTLYTRNDSAELVFAIMFTESLGIHLGGTSGRAVELPPVPLFAADGTPNHKMVAAHAAVTGRTVNVRDAYDTREFDFSGTRAFDERTGYRSRSLLTVPMRNHQDEIIGVLQLLNARDPRDGRPRAFSSADEALVNSLASQAAIAMTNRALIEDQKALFEAFIQLIAAAIDDKSPYTGGHCRRVPELTMMLADAAARTDSGPLADFDMDEDDRYELHIAGWLHDCGKVTTPEYVVDKATKLETIYDRIALVDLRFQVLRQQARIDLLEARAQAADETARAAAEQRYRDTLAALDDDQAFLRRSNVGGEFMAEEARARVRAIGARPMPPGSAGPTLLDDDEVDNLSISRGTLTDAEREVINNHIVTTIKMLESLPYPRTLRRVPEFAGGHHERMDGRGYPRGLRREQMSVQARVMGIADIFEALTAGDRPYKPAMRLSQALHILGRMKEDNHVDPDLFDVFVRERVYLRYAEEFLEPDQIDDVDEQAIPGYTP